MLSFSPEAQQKEGAGENTWDREDADQPEELCLLREIEFKNEDINNVVMSIDIFTSVGYVADKAHKNHTPRRTHANTDKVVSVPEN